MDSSEFHIVDFHWSQELEDEYTTYMANCESQIDSDFYETDDDFETLSGQPFCGCDVCYTREQLFFLVPRIISALKNGQIVVPGDEK